MYARIEATHVAALGPLEGMGLVIVSLAIGGKAL